MQSSNKKAKQKRWQKICLYNIYNVLICIAFSLHSSSTNVQYKTAVHIASHFVHALLYVESRWSKYILGLSEVYFGSSVKVSAMFWFLGPLLHEDTHKH